MPHALLTLLAVIATSLTPSAYANAGALPQPPRKQYKVIVENNAGAPVHWIANGSTEISIPKGKYHILQSASAKAQKSITYHNGHKVVYRNVGNVGHFSFRWEGDTLMLVDLLK